MLSDALTVSFALHLLLGSNYFALALPSSRSSRSPGTPSRSLHVPLRRRAEPQRNETEFGLWAKQQKQALEGKYGGGGSSNTKRSSGTNLCVLRFFPFKNILLTFDAGSSTKTLTRGTFLDAYVPVCAR